MLVGGGPPRQACPQDRAGLVFRDTGWRPAGCRAGAGWPVPRCDLPRCAPLGPSTAPGGWQHPTPPSVLDAVEWGWGGAWGHRNCIDPRSCPLWGSRQVTRPLGALFCLSVTSWSLRPPGLKEGCSVSSNLGTWTVTPPGRKAVAPHACPTAVGLESLPSAGLGRVGQTELTGGARAPPNPQLLFWVVQAGLGPSGDRGLGAPGGGGVARLRSGCPRSRMGTEGAARR